MLINWYNSVHRLRSCNITSIDDIQKYDKDGVFGLRIKRDKAWLGGTLGEFKSVEKRDKAYDDIKNALDAGEEEFMFRPRYYEYSL